MATIIFWKKEKLRSLCCDAELGHPNFPLYYLGISESPNGLLTAHAIVTVTSNLGTHHWHFKVV